MMLRLFAVVILLFGTECLATKSVRRRLREVNKDSVKKSLESGRKELEKVMSLIYHRYELGTEIGRSFFYTASNMDSKAFDIIKWRLATKIIHSDSKPYHMVFGGSSVTAGHDNYFNQSYPIIFKRRMEKVFSVLDVDLLVHNIAQGANNCVPYIMCNEAMGGYGIDFLNWEQSYNCGRDESVFEAALRNVMWNGPGVIYYSASGSPSAGKCSPSTDPVAYNADHWTPAIANLKEWKVTDDAVQEQKSIIFKFHESGRSHGRFSGTSKDYKSVGAMGFNVWERNSQCIYVNAKTNATEKGCSASDALSCSLHFMTKEATVFGKEDGRGANWHPPRAMHLLRGEIIAWQYSLVMYETINMIIQDLIARDIASLATEYSSKLKSFEEEKYPNPKRCGNVHCEHRPQCYTNFLPHFGKDHLLKDIVIGDVSWTQDSNDYSDWSKKYGFLDLKTSYHSPKGDNSKELHILINIEEQNFIWICGNSKESLAHAIFYLDQNVKLSNAAEYKPSTSREVWTKKKYVGFECKELQDLPKGKHVLSIGNGGDKSLDVSHVITW